MFRRYINFIRGVSVNAVGKTGVLLTTSSFVTFVVLELARIVGVLTNAYIGLITYLLFPFLFVVGLILIPFGWRKYRRTTGMATRDLLNRQFQPQETQAGFFGSRLFMSISILTLVNVIFLFVASSRMLEFMDEPVFCGTACHSVMNPEWVTYQQSPHARVKCVECHVGEGAQALLDSKLNGMWQMISLTFNLYERPIPTPVHQLRPARETCEKCHWPEKFYGNRLKEITRYKEDEQSTPQYTTLALKVDAGVRAASGGIHWHVAEENQVRYASVDDKRDEMLWVEVRSENGEFKRYTNDNLTKPEDSTREFVRTMDCIDCHNRATHIYEWPDDALDKRITLGLLDRSLPFIKQQGMKAITNEYPDSTAAMAGIANQINSFYQREHPDIALSRSAGIDSAIAVLREVYNRNIHHGMNITWGTYASKIGHHDDEGGCFRCHDGSMVAEDGSRIDDDCTLCHSIIDYEADKPFEFAVGTNTLPIDSDMYRFLRTDFLRNVQLAVQDMPTTHE